MKSITIRLDAEATARFEKIKNAVNTRWGNIEWSDSKLALAILKSGMPVFEKRYKADHIKRTIKL